MENSASTTNSHSIYPPILRKEYQTLVEELGPCASDDTIIGALVANAGWTHRGGTEVLGLAREYGTSILRNALALADALGIEDGSRGI